MKLLQMEFKNDHWPIHPKWLSIKKGKIEFKFNPNTEGLFMPDTLRGFIAEASDHPDILNPLSLFQVIPDIYEYEDTYRRIEVVTTTNPYIKTIIEGKKIIRIDPGNLYKNHTCCNIFRDCEEGNCKWKCFDLDSCIALFFHKDLQDIHYYDQNSNYIGTFIRIKDEYNLSLEKPENAHASHLYVEQYESYDEKNNRNYHRIYVKYRCKYSGFDEYFFPVIHSGSVIAVIMQGQRPNPELKSFNMFADYVNDPNVGEKLRKAIQTLKDNSAFCNQESLSLIRRDSIYLRVKALTKRTNDAVNSIARQYVSEEFTKIETQFRDKIKIIKLEGKKSFDLYKAIMNETLAVIFNTFSYSNGFIRFYSKKKKHDNSKEEDFELIGDSSCDKEYSMYEILTFQNLPKNKYVIEKEELIKYLDSKKRALICENDTLRLEMPFINRMSYIVWIRFKNEGRKYKTQRDSYNETLKLFYHVLFEPYIILNEISFEELLEKSIRISVHETSQVIPPIIQKLNNRFDKYKDEVNQAYYFRKFQEEFIDRVYDEKVFKEMVYEVRNIKNRIALLDGLFNRSTLLFKSVEPEVDWIDLHQIIYSTRSLFEERTYDINRQEIVLGYDSVLSKYSLYSDKNFLSHILFNLVDNALKYGIRGSRIYISVLIDEANKDLLNYGRTDYLKELTIVVDNYGFKIDDKIRKNDIFELYFRSTNYPDGLGIGLFIARKLVESLGYTINCVKSKFVTSINLPLYYHYSKQQYPDVLKEQVSKKPQNDYDISSINKVVNKREDIMWDITPEEIDNQLFENIYLNRFEVIIPINNNFKLKKNEYR